jgi:hypothetical protein
LQQVAREVIKHFEQGARSISEVLTYRNQQAEHATSQDSEEDRSAPQAPQARKDEEPLSEEGLKALEQLIAVLRNNIADPNQYFSKCSERDLLD